MLAATALLSTVTTTGNNVFAQSDSEEDSNGNSAMYKTMVMQVMRVATEIPNLIE